MSEMESRNGPWCPFPQNGKAQLRYMETDYNGIKFQANMGVVDAALWADRNDTLPILMLEIAQVKALVEVTYDAAVRSESYEREFCGSYRRVITSLKENGLTKGMTLQEQVKLSLRAAKSYARSFTDNAAQKGFIHRRMRPELWDVLGRRLQECMIKIAAQSKNWINSDPLKDFMSTEWTTLEQGGTNFVADEVTIAEDLVSKDEMLGARQALQEIADETADHLGLLITIEERILTYEKEQEQWLRDYSSMDWYNMDNYDSSKEWTDRSRSDGWPDWEYHAYRNIDTALDAEKSGKEYHLPTVERLVPQFWSCAQALSRGWHTFAEALIPADDTWNQTVATQIDKVCQLMRRGRSPP